MTETTITSYLDIFHPHVLDEMQSKMVSIPFSREAVGEVASTVCMDTPWENRMVLLAACLMLFSPETVIARCPVRKGVASGIASVLEISQPAISKQVDQARYYYQRTEWCRKEVDRIVKEVKG